MECETIQPIAKKRGRKSKKEIMLLQEQEQERISARQLNADTNNDIGGDTNAIESIEEHSEIPSSEEPKTFKKRGRKPKGGKIIQQTTNNDTHTDEKQNVILHLKCSMADLSETPNYENGNSLDAYNTDICNETMYNYEPIVNSSDEHKNEYHEGEHDNDPDCDKSGMKEIWKKIKQLEYNLHINNISKKSDCFWDTCDFDNPPIYIPKHYINGTYHVYGCFCSPECAVAYLMKEDIDRSAKFERYQLLNDLYSKIYGHKKGIPEASDPRYLLDKYLGNLSIKEYRTLLRSGKMFLVIDKPLTRVFSELHEDTDDFILNNKIIPSATYQVKGKSQKKRTNKMSLLSEKFGIN
jgi:hypothetical protein